jgi:thiol:disulfide interchange protein
MSITSFLRHGESFWAWLSTIDLAHRAPLLVSILSFLISTLSFPRRRESRNFKHSENQVVLDPRLRNDDKGSNGDNKKQTRPCLMYTLCALFLLLHSPTCNATSTPMLASTITQSHTTLTLKSSTETIQPNSEFWLQLDWALDPHWYIYAQNPGDGGLPPSLEFELPVGITIEETTWPKPSDLSKEGLVIYGYKDTCKALIRLKASANYKASSLDTIKVTVRWGICHDQCIVDNITLGLRFPTKELFEKDSSNHNHETKTAPQTPVESTNDATHIGLLLFFALIGGVLLNLMPCVLPVLSLKLLDFAKLRDSSDSQHTIRTHALLYTGGVLATFQFLNISLSLLRLLGHQIGWGFQLQSPPFIVFLACLFLALTLNLFGVFEIGLRTIHLEENLKSTNNPRLQSFLKGVLACIVATPCSAPFMGTAIAASLVQPFWVNTLIFTSLGIGLSLPFLCLSAWPKVIDYLPKPGAWMQSLKQFMGFLMMGSVGWMLWILDARFSDGLCWVLLGLWCLSLGFWFYGKLCPPVHSSFKRSIGASLFALCSVGALISFHYALDETPPSKEQLIFQPYTQADVDKALANNHPVLINFTARWCVTCQTNKRFVLESKTVIDRLKAEGVSLFEADWTHHDATITKKLESYNRNSIPLVAYYPKTKGKERSEPIFLPAILTENQLIEILNKK